MPAFAFRSVHSEDSGVRSGFALSKADMLAQPAEPPAVIVQCKRQKQKVERGVVEALYADMLEEHANAGLVVTTSDISLGPPSMSVRAPIPVIQCHRSPH